MTAVNNFYDEDLTNRTHTGDTNWTFVAGMAQIAAASLSANTKYLIKARALFGGDDTSQVFGCRISTADDAAIATKSEAVLEPSNAAYYFPYYFVHSFETDGTPADVEFQIKTFDGAFEVQIDQMSLELIDLADLGASNYFETVHADDASEYPTTQATEFTIAGANLGTDEWAVWWYQRTAVGSGGTSRNYRVEAFSALDTATSVVRQRDENEGEDPNELRMSGGALRHKASSGTPDFEVQTWEEATQANDLNAGGYAIALKTAAFESGGFQWDYTAASTTLDTTERTFATVAAYSPGTTADHLVEGSISRDVSNAVAQVHLEDDGTEMRVGDQPMSVWQSYDLTAFPLVGLFHRNNILSSDTSTYTLRAKISTGSETAEFRWLILLSLELASGAGSASPAVIARSFGMGATTQVGGGVDVQDLIARSFTVDAATAKGAGVDVQDLIARSFALDQVVPVGAAVDVQDLIARLFALDPVTTSNTDGGAGSASPAAIVLSFTVDAVTLAGLGVDVQDLIARSFVLDGVTPVGAGVDVQDLIARSFALGAPTLAGAGVDVQDLIARAFTVDAVTLAGLGVQVAPLIARSFGLGAVTVAGAGVDAQDVIARAFTVDAVTLVGGGVQTAPLIALSFVLDAVTLSNSDSIVGARIVAVSVIGRSRASAISRRRIKVTDRNRVT